MDDVDSPPSSLDGEGEPSVKRARADIDASKEKRSVLKEPEWTNKILSSLLGDTSTHDVTFTTSDGSSVSAHRLVLAAGSPVFHAMLYGKMKESHEKEVELPSVDANCLQHILTFMYTGQVEATLAECQSLLLAARYFNIATLEIKCIGTIANSLNDLNWCKLTVFAKQQELNELLKQCYVYMESNISKIINRPDFKSLPAECITEICNNSNLCVKELDLFFAIQEWSDFQKDSLPVDTIQSISRLIRYPLIHRAELVEIVGPSTHADPCLYKAALEYHVWPDSFNGPQDQLNIRKHYFDFCTASKGMTIEHNPKGTFITTLTEAEATQCKCSVRIYPTEASPVQFKFCLRSYGGDMKLFVSSIFKVIRLPIQNFPLHKELDGCITVKENSMQIKVGNVTKSVNVDSDLEGFRGGIVFGVSIKNKGGQVKIIKM